MLKKTFQIAAAVALLAAVGCGSARRPGAVAIPPARLGSMTPAPAPTRPIALPPATLQAPAGSNAALQVRAATNALAPAGAAVARPPVTAASAAPAPGTPQAATARPPLSAPAAVPATAASSGKIASTYLVKGGDQIVVFLRGIPTEQQIEDVVDEMGYISLPYINEVMAAGKSSSELERSIRQLYLSQQIFKNVSVNVVLPSQSYFVRGEVRQAGRFPLMSGVTLVQAIASAGGYTEFANSGKVQLLRGSMSTYYDARALEVNPQKDIAIEAGDVIVVHRSIF